MFTVSEILDCQRIAISEEHLNKKRVLAKLSELIATADEALDENTLLQQFIARERLGSTAIGYGVALPHIRQTVIRQPVAAVLLLKQPIAFDGFEHGDVDLFFALAVPEQATQQHLDLLAQIATLLDQESLRTEARRAQQPKQLCQLFTATSTKN